MADIAVIGLGHVGLPLAVAFSEKRPVVGFDVDSERIGELQSGVDDTREVSEQELAAAFQLSFTDSVADIAECSVYIVTVPTPIDAYKTPDLTPLRKASESLASVLKAGDIVVYESTVFPGATGEVCVPILERGSALVFNQDFFVGYSPERINPGDREHRVTSIQKVTSGSTPAIADQIDALYAAVITAGTYKASSIRVAEAAKVIENTQRDVNIALMNELSMIFTRMGINTHEVLAAAGTKWNFLPFKPGLVGGHCIGVDPYYLTYKAEALGYHPEMVLAGRRINDNMGPYAASELIKAMIKAGQRIAGARVLVLGLTFKENCPDLRNTRVIDVIRELEDFGCKVDVADAGADPGEAFAEYGLELVDFSDRDRYDAVILAVPHREYNGFTAADFRSRMTGSGVLFDLKGVFPANDVDLSL